MRNNNLQYLLYLGLDMRFKNIMLLHLYINRGNNSCLHINLLDLLQHKNYYDDQTPSKRSYQSFLTNEQREGNRDNKYPIVYIQPTNDFDERLIEIERMLQ